MASEQLRMEDLMANWRCVVACGLILLFPFQYGVDFGLIGGLQAMVGFLQVCLFLYCKLSFAGQLTCYVAS
jgi:hypothetical protein